VRSGPRHKSTFNCQKIDQIHLTACSRRELFCSYSCMFDYVDPNTRHLRRKTCKANSKKEGVRTSTWRSTTESSHLHVRVYGHISYVCLAEYIKARSKVTSKSSKFTYRGPCKHASTQPWMLSQTTRFNDELLFCDITCHVCYQATPYRLDQGADLERHVGYLDKYMTDDYLQAIEDAYIVIDSHARRSVSKNSDRTGEGRSWCVR
jgi:hypothetical protein